MKHFDVLKFLHVHKIPYITKGVNVKRNEVNINCPFCANLDDLADKKMYRAVHTLLALRESVAAVNAGEDDRIAAIYAQSSPKYRKAFLQWQARQDRERA